MHGIGLPAVFSFMTHVYFMHAFTHTYLQPLAFKILAIGVIGMAFFEQAAVLATAWANHGELKALGAKHSLCVVRSSELSRSSLHAKSCKHVFGKSLCSVFYSIIVRSFLKA